MDGGRRASHTLDGRYGSGYGLVIRDADGSPRELHRLLPSAEIARVDPLTSEPIYQYGLGEAGGATVSQTYGWRDLIVIRPTVTLSSIGANGFVNGLAPIRAARNAIGLAPGPSDRMGLLGVLAQESGRSKFAKASVAGGLSHR